MEIKIHDLIKTDKGYEQVEEADIYHIRTNKRVLCEYDCIETVYHLDEDGNFIKEGNKTPNETKQKAYDIINDERTKQMLYDTANYGLGTMKLTEAIKQRIKEI